MCYLPTWPFFTGGSGKPGKIPSRFHPFDWSESSGLLSNSDGVDDSVKPNPRCIPRVEFQTPISAYIKV